LAIEKEWRGIMIDARQLEVRNALRGFLRAFENRNRTVMERRFAEHSVSFDPVIAEKAVRNDDV
jgi:hypothetical protein